MQLVIATSFPLIVELQQEDVFDRPCKLRR